MCSKRALCFTQLFGTPLHFVVGVLEELALRAHQRHGLVAVGLRLGGRELRDGALAGAPVLGLAEALVLEEAQHTLVPGLLPAEVLAVLESRRSAGCGA